MFPLETNRRVLTWLCVFPPKKETTRARQMAYTIFSLSVLGVNVGSFFISLAYFSRYMSVNLEQSLFALVQMLGEANMSYISIVTFILRRKLTATYKSLLKIYQAHKDQDTVQYLAEANQQSEMLWSIFFNVVKWGTGSIIMSAVLTVSLGVWLEGQYVTKYAYHAYKALLPWDQMSLMGYIGEIVYDILLSFAYVFAGSFLLYYIALCQHHHAFYKMFKHSLLDAEHSDRNSKEFLCQLIRFHVSVQKLFRESAEAFSLFILVQLITAMLMLAGSIYQMDLQIQNPNFDGSMILITIAVSTSLLFFYCYFGKIATDSLFGMADCVYESNWHSLPNDLQKCVVIIIRSAQKKLYYHGFEMVILDLEAFSKFFKAVFTYYMMFKTITE